MLDRPNNLPNGGGPYTAGVPSYHGAGMPAFQYAHPHHYHSTLNGYGDDQPHDGFNAVQLLFYVVKHRWLVVMLALTGLAAGFAVTMMQTPKYQASARLEVMTPSARVFQDMEIVTESADVRTFLTAREKLLSRALAQRAVHQLGLTQRADYLFPAPEFSVLNILNRAFGIRSAADLDDYSPEQREQIAINRLLRNLSVELVQNTSLLSVNYRDQNPDYAREVANQVAQSYIDQRVDQTGETSELARQFIQEQVIQVKAKLEASEKALVDYARQAGITATGDQSSLISSNLQSINSALSKAIEDRLNYQLLVQQIDEGNAASIEQVLSSEGLQKLNSKIAELSAEYQQKLSTFKPAFPEMRQLKAQIDELRRQYSSAVKIIADGIRQKHMEIVSREADLRTKIGELETEQLAFQDRNIQYTILNREVESDRAQYQSLIAKLSEVGVGSEITTRNAVIVDYANRPSSPYSPSMPLNLGMALILFLSISFCIIYVLELLNNTFINPDQLEKELRIPVMGILPRTDDRELTATLADPKSGLSEAYRSLRTALQFSGSDGVPKSLVITSAEPSEGKSTTAFKLAQDFGALGNKVLVIDADMRKPNLHRLFGTDNTLGLSNLLTNTVKREDLRKVVRTSIHRNVWIVTSGTIPPNPADLLSSPKMALMVEQLLQKFDIVILDAPPIVGLSDAPILGRLAQGTLMVVSSDQVTRKSAAAALKRMRSAGANVVGGVLSKFSVGTFDYNYAYKYMNYYYYSYGAEAPKLEGKSSEPEYAIATRSSFLARLGSNLHSSLSRFAQRLKPIS